MPATKPGALPNLESPEQATVEREPGAGGLDIRMPEPPGGSDMLETAFSSILQWDYSVQRRDLRNLYEKSKGAMWNVQLDVDWSVDVDPEAENTPN
ncbi:MAG: hypothetical protein VB934_23345, partial [Polyangiaceae bacterium]